jgi:Resolvase, N terminal domain
MSRSQGLEYQQDFVAFNELACLLDRLRWAVSVIMWREELVTLLNSCAKATPSLSPGSTASPVSGRLAEHRPRASTTRRCPQGDQAADRHGIAAGKCFLDMLGVFAKFETNLRRERQMKGIAQVKANGVYADRQRAARLDPGGEDA